MQIWLLFDAVGTLIYPDPPVPAVYCAAGRRSGSELSEPEIARRFKAALQAEHRPDGSRSPPPTSETLERQRWQRLVAAVFDDVAHSRQAQLFDELWNHFGQPRSWRLHDEVFETLAAMQRAGCRLGIASNFDERLLNVVRGMPALAACEQVFVSSHVGFVKPDPRFFAGIERTLGASGEQFVLVGDDWHCDVAGARAAGWKAVWLNRDGCRSDHESVRSLADLPQALRAKTARCGV
jgi:putative hydrolase of the HAD superfamily